MQENKGLVKLFALLFGLVSIYQLSFTFKANQIENNAAQYAISKVSESQIDFDKQRTAIEAKYLDSLTKVTVFDLWFEKYNFDQVKNRSMNLGLDLKGGISVILQISVKDILKTLSNNSTDPIFNQALIDAEEKQKNSQDTYIEDFFVAFDAIKGDTKLSSTYIFANRDLREEITFDMSDEDVQTIILKKIDQSIVAAFEVLRKRVDKFGITQPNIQRLGNSGRILVELPGAKDIDRVKKLLQSTAQLEFWYAFSGQDLSNFIVQALQGENITIYGEGSQTRSFCYVDDLVNGLIKLMGSPESFTGPVNLGNPVETTILELAESIIKFTKSSSKIVNQPMPQDDPVRRRPDISMAQKNLAWQPTVPLDEGLDKTIHFFKSLLSQ